MRICPSETQKGSMLFKKSTLSNHITYSDIDYNQYENNDCIKIENEPAEITNETFIFINGDRYFITIS